MSEHIYKLLKHHHNHHDHHRGSRLHRQHRCHQDQSYLVTLDVSPLSSQGHVHKGFTLSQLMIVIINATYIVFVSFTLGLKMESLNCCYNIGCCNTNSCLDCKILCWNKVIFNFWSQYTSQKCKTNLKKKSEFKLVFFIQQRTCNVIDMLSYWRCFDKCETRNFI